MKRFGVVGLIALAALPGTKLSFAQGLQLECDRSIQGLAGAIGYQGRTNDLRCEGFFESPVSATGIELLSATIGPISFDAQQDEHAVIAVPALPSGSAEVIDIHVVGLPLGLYYRLDAKAAPGSALRWPLGDVVGQAGLKSSDVGAYGRLGDEPHAAILPLSVTPPGASSSGSGIELALRSAVDLERIWWRELRDDGASAYQELASNIYGGEVVRFAVPEGPEGSVRLEFAARLAGSGRQRSISLLLLRPN